MYNFFKVMIISSFFLMNNAIISAAYNSADLDFGSPLVNAADSGNEYLVSNYIRNGVSLNSRGEFGATALMRASYRGHENLVKYLLEMGADVHAKDDGGATSLHLAARKGHKTIVELLLKYGARLDTEDNEGYTPLKRAILSQDLSVISYILKSGADLDYKGSIGLSAIELANETNNKNLLALLEEKSNEVPLPPQHDISLYLDDGSARLKGYSKKTIQKETLPKMAEDEKVLFDLERGPKKSSMSNLKSPASSQKDAELADLIQNKSNKMIDSTLGYLKKNVINIETSPPQLEVEKAINKSPVYAGHNQKDGVITVGEAIKLDDNKSFADDNVIIGPQYMKSEYQVKDLNKPYAYRVENNNWDMSMEISGFKTEVDAIILWQRLSDENCIHGKKATIVSENLVESHEEYKLRFDNYSNAKEVFDDCKKIRNVDPKALCYIIHNIY